MDLFVQELGLTMKYRLCDISCAQLGDDPYIMYLCAFFILLCRIKLVCELYLCILVGTSYKPNIVFNYMFSYVLICL